MHKATRQSALSSKFVLTRFTISKERKKERKKEKALNSVFTKGQFPEHLGFTDFETLVYVIRNDYVLLLEINVSGEQ